MYANWRQCVQQSYAGYGVWIPAFAGMTNNRAGMVRAAVAETGMADDGGLPMVAGVGVDSRFRGNDESMGGYSL